MSIFRLKHIFLAAQLVLAGMCLYWLATNIDWSDVWLKSAEVSLPALVAVFAMRYVPYVFQGLRINAILERKIGVGNAFQACLLCIGCNNILPARMGELVKMVFIRLHSPLLVPQVLAGVVMERLLDITLLLALIGIFAAGMVNAAVAGALALVAGLVWAAIVLLVLRGERLLALPLWQGLPRKARDFAGRIVAMLARVLKGRVLGRAFACTLGVWAMNVVFVYGLFNLMLGMDLPLHALGLLMVVVFFSASLFVIPGGVGIMEVALIAALGGFGVEQTTAATAAVLARLLYTTPSLVACFAILCLNRTFGISDLRQGLSQARTEKA